MEDILASIRKILNEDEAAPAPAAQPAATPQPEAEDEPEALILTPDMMIAPPEPEPQPEPAPPPPPMLLALEEAPPPPEPAPPPAPPEPPAMPDPTPAESAAGSLIAPAAAAAAAAALGQLSRAVAQDRTAGLSRSGPSIEDVVREELRPLLKEWLDAHLPGIVERMVRAEIERVMAR